MIDDLVVTARFPLGLYQGAGQDGAGQAFPAPSRLAAALLSVCGPEGLDTVRALFEADPPLIDHPDVTPGAAVAWWRPQSGRWREEFDVNKQTAAGRIEGKPLPSAMYGDEPVWYRWADLGSLADALGPIAARVPYLGRATSPVVLEVERSTTPAAPPEAGRVRLTPAVSGSHRVTVPTGGLLADLEAAHASRVELDIAGFDLPVTVLRPEASYARTTAAPLSVAARLSGDSRAVDGYVSETLEVLVPSAPVAPDSVHLCCRWIDGLIGAGATIPVPDQRGVLRAVLVDRETRATTGLDAATLSGVVRLDPGIPGQTTASQRWIGRRLLGTSLLWVSVTGIDPDDVETGLALVQEITDVTEQAVVACSTSSAPRDARFPDLAGTGEQYLTVQLAAPVAGPLVARLDGRRPLHFLAVDPTTGALR